MGLKMTNGALPLTWDNGVTEKHKNKQDTKNTDLSVLTVADSEFKAKITN